MGRTMNSADYTLLPAKGEFLEVTSVTRILVVVAIGTL